MNCPTCGAKRGEWHQRGCDWEQCPYCGDALRECVCSPGGLPPLDDRIPWAGRSEWAMACLDLGFFKRRVGKTWLPCDADSPGSVLDVNRLLRECVWNREAKRFEPRRRKSRRQAKD
jgi:hypothetical protein